MEDWREGIVYDSGCEVDSGIEGVVGFGMEMSGSSGDGGGLGGSVVDVPAAFSFNTSSTLRAAIRCKM